MQNLALSYWEHQSFFGPADVAIIGAGLVGLTAALYLKQRRPAWRVVVLERGPLPAGASTKNAGFACFGSLSELLEQEQRGDVQAVVAARWQGLARLRELLGDAALDYRPVGGFELFRAGADDALAAECLGRMGHFNELLGPVVGTATVFRAAPDVARRSGFGGIGTVIENTQEGSLDAGRLVRTLLARAWAADVPVLTACAVAALAPAPAGGARLRLANGASLDAAQVLLATNAFAQELYPALAVVPGRGQVLVTEPLPQVQLVGTFHYDRGYTYFRQLPDHRVLLGGGRHLNFAAETTTAPGLTGPVQAYLETLLHEVIAPGRRPRIDYRWSGVMGFGPTLAPLVEWVQPGVLAAVRCNGMGVALGAGLGWQAAEKLSAP